MKSSSGAGRSTVYHRIVDSVIAILALTRYMGGKYIGQIYTQLPSKKDLASKISSWDMW
jgi:hypothetical protein